MKRRLQKRSKARWVLLSFTLVMLVGLCGAVVVVSADEDAMPAWLEPRGISLIELVGRVPDEYLQGTILSYGDGDGIVVYNSGSRIGNTVRISTTLYPRLTYPPWAGGAPLSSFGCLGQTPHYDHQGTMVPTATLRVWDVTGQELTQQIRHMYLRHMDTLQPSASSLEPFRYPENAYGPVPGQLPLPLGPEGLVIPPNSGCRIAILGADYRQLTGVFTLEFDSDVHANIQSTQVITFQSYIGAGSVGIFDPLMQQMRGTFGDRHARVALQVPDRANFLLVKFPPMPGDAYSDQNVAQPPYPNADRPSGGTYRLSRGLWELSADLTFSAAFPLQIGWRDADQSAGTEFLPVMAGLTDLAPPEYVLAVGVPYHPCYTTGYCDSDVLHQIYDAQMTLEIVYLQVIRLTGNGQWVPVKMAGPAWTPETSLETRISDTQELFSTTRITTTTHSIFLPYIAREIQEPTPVGCPCGYFDDLGRMLDFYPGEAIFGSWDQ